METANVLLPPHAHPVGGALSNKSAGSFGWRLASSVDSLYTENRCLKLLQALVYINNL